MKRRLLSLSVGSLVLLPSLILLAFALPIQSWRTGQDGWSPLTVELDPPKLPRRVWIDTDAACGEGRSRDPDDCLALLALLNRPEVEVVGVSTVFGNAPLQTTDRVTHKLIDQIAAAGGPKVSVFRGCGSAISSCAKGEAAEAALRTALERGPLTVLALGPVTNIAAVLTSTPQLRDRLSVVAVMGRRPGHRFHPTEGRSGSAMLFGHGPVFTDLNFVLDPDAAAALVDGKIHLTLIPYEAARDVLLTGRDLDRIASKDASGAWVAARSREWLDFWRQAIGLAGFYPFDLVAAIYLVSPQRFGCARVNAWVGRDPRRTIFERSSALLVSQQKAYDSGDNSTSATYCFDVDASIDHVF
jgi:purine nucleosidase